MTSKAECPHGIVTASASVRMDRDGLLYVVTEYRCDLCGAAMRSGPVRVREAIPAREVPKVEDLPV